MGVALAARMACQGTTELDRLATVGLSAECGSTPTAACLHVGEEEEGCASAALKALHRMHRPKKEAIKEHCLAPCRLGRYTRRCAGDLRPSEPFARDFARTPPTSLHVSQHVPVAACGSQPLSPTPTTPPPSPPTPFPRCPEDISGFDFVGG
ncbi:hypothetical protein C0Q70_01741 [Pomacea canaliculata]|uniref:Uncharacterized protein n=1 Tax=Pomacea canaliculata TaxID=400727 RepID=A0A2T7Q0B9_POMCA|nr:hypothetical protein C0Q70_01741 [Pomacea canaliculata]